MIKNYCEKLPKISEEAFIAESCDIIGDVEIGEGSSIWYRAVLRGDTDSIRIGRNSNVQDGTIVHCNSGYPSLIGDNVNIGHNSIIHGATIKDNCTIGMSAVILNGAVINENCIIGAGTIVTQGKEIPEGSLVLGAPGKVVRTLTPEEIEEIKKTAEEYVNLAKEHKESIMNNDL